MCSITDETALADTESQRMQLAQIGPHQEVDLAMMRYTDSGSGTGQPPLRVRRLGNSDGLLSPRTSPVDLPGTIEPEPEIPQYNLVSSSSDP